MILKTQIKDELWSTISNSYEAENYRNAILDAMQYLSDLLREKSGTDNDGAKLVNDAMGGNNPKIKINKYQTQSEQDEHKGLLQILTGMYIGIRNPRSHERITDKKSDADRIIYFIDYLVGILAEAKSPFNLDEFVEHRIFDDNFVQTDKYAELLINEIPRRKCFDVLIEIFRQKARGDGKSLQLLTHKLLEIIDKDDKKTMISIISDELKTVQRENEIRRTIQLLPSDLWLEIEEVSKIRIENILLKSIADGYFYGENLAQGAFGTWANELLPYFTLKTEAINTLINKFDDTREFEYVLKYFWSVLQDLVAEENSYLRRRYTYNIAYKVRDQNTPQEVRNKIRDKLLYYPEEWKAEFSKLLTNVVNEDGTLFTLESTVDDIPF